MFFYELAVVAVLLGEVYVFVVVALVQLFYVKPHKGVELSWRQRFISRTEYNFVIRSHSRVVEPVG